MWYILWSKSKLNKLFFIPANLKVCRDNRSAIIVSVKIVRNYCKIMIHWSASLSTYFHRKTGSLCRNIYSLLDLIHKSCAFFFILWHIICFTPLCYVFNVIHSTITIHTYLFNLWLFIKSNVSKTNSFIVSCSSVTYHQMDSPISNFEIAGKF